MKKRALWIVAAAAAVFGAVWGRQAWSDTHPDFEVRSVDLPSYTIELPAHWPDPRSPDTFVAVESAPDSREGSLDEFRWEFSILDEGAAEPPEAVAAKMFTEYPTQPRIEEVRLANGVAAKTWTVWVPRGELAQKHRGYVFKAPNGHVYSVWQPLAYDWRTRRRYDNLFRAVLGSMRFKS
jgi:hypothetical protein